MTQRFAWGLGLAAVTLSGALMAQTMGTATGKGTIDNRGKPVPFAPQVAAAYMQNFQALRFTWVVLTEKAVPAGMLAGTADHTEALRQWCEKEKTPFAALQLDAKSGVNQLVTCPANGGTNIDMVNTVNGVDSIVAKIDARDAAHVKGSLKTTTGSYTFDAALVK